MEAIRNYLETMFMHLPSTPEVQKAKAALYEMMEDKYNELLAQGHTENEAVGTVISEFGNLEELKETLGISEIMDEQPQEDKRKLSFDEVYSFLRQRAKEGMLVALGAALCVACSVPIILIEGYLEYIRLNEEIADMIGVGLMLVMIAVAVGLFIYAGSIAGRWKHLKAMACSVDFETMNYVADEANRFSPIRVMMITFGVILCIFCWFPAAILSMFPGAKIMEPIGVSLILIFVATAVFLFITAGTRSSSYHTILSLTDPGTIGRGAAASTAQGAAETVYYDNRFLAFLMPVYWPTITCIYLVWSFLTFNWHITWIIWPIAAIVGKIIRNSFGKN